MKRKARRPERQGELNIVPYLDIMVNLVMFMLMSMAGFISFRAVNAMATPAPTVAARPPRQKEDPLQLKLGVSAGGFYLVGNGAVLPPDVRSEQAATGARVAPTIPLTASGEYDYGALTTKLAEVKAAFPDESRLALAAVAGTRYDVIIRTLDATHGDESHPLFPDVAFDLDGAPAQ